MERLALSRIAIPASGLGYLKWKIIFRVPSAGAFCLLEGGYVLISQYWDVLDHPPTVLDSSGEEDAIARSNTHL